MANKVNAAMAKAAGSKKKVRGGQAQAYPRKRSGVQQGSKNPWSSPGRFGINESLQQRSPNTTSTGKPRADSKALARAKAIRSGMSKVEIRNQIMAEQYAKSQKALVKLRGSKTPKQLKDDRVKVSERKSYREGKGYTSISKNNTQVKTTFVARDKYKKIRVSAKNPVTNGVKPTAAKITSDSKNRAKNIANKAGRVGGKALGGKIALAITAGSLAKGVYDSATKEKKKAVK